MSPKKRLIGVAVLGVVLISAGYWTLHSQSNPGLVSILLVVLAYLMGVMAFLAGFVFPVWTYAITLPVMSWLYAILTSFIVLIERVLFGKILEKSFQKIPFLMKIEMKIRNSSLMEKIRTHAKKILKKTGATSPHRMKFIKVIKCAKCKKDILHNSILCPYCGMKIRMSKQQNKRSLRP